MGSLLYRVGGWCASHRRRVVALWLVLIVGLAVFASAVKQPTTSEFSIPGTQSQKALDLLNKKFPGTGGAQAQVVFSVSGAHKLTSARAKQAVDATLARLRKAPQVVSVSDPYRTGRLSRSEQIAYATVAYPVD